jgi:hypothetical protein
MQSRQANDPPMKLFFGQDPVAFGPEWANALYRLPRERLILIGRRHIETFMPISKKIRKPLNVN